MTQSWRQIPSACLRCPPLDALERPRALIEQRNGRKPTPAAVADGLWVDAKFPQLDDCRSAPADRVRRERQHERHAVCLSEWLSVAQDSVVPRCRLDGKARGFKPADELTHVFPHLAPRQVCREKYGVRRAPPYSATTLNEVSASPPAALISCPLGSSNAWHLNPGGRGAPSSAHPGESSERRSASPASRLNGTWIAIDRAAACDS
jgi:hypothetical protein